MTSGFAGGYKMESSEARALRSINTESYDYRDQAKLLTKLTSDVTYMAQYMRQMQKGIDDANANFIEQIGDFINEILVVIGGQGDTGFDFGDLKYIFQAIGALFGFDQQTGIGAIFPINLFNAAWHFFSTYILPLNNFGDAVDNFIDSAIATILDVLGEIPIVGQAVQILATWISDFRDAIRNGGEFLNGLLSDWTAPLVQAIKNVVNVIQEIVDWFTNQQQAAISNFKNWAQRLPIMDTINGILNALNIPSLDGSKIMTGTLAEDRIASLSAGKIGSGIFSADRIPGLDAAKIETGTLGRGLIGIDDFENIAAGSGFEGLSPWLLGFGWSIATDQFYAGTKSLKKNGSIPGNCTLLGLHATRPDEQFYVEFWVRRDSTWNGTATNSELRINNAAGTLIYELGYGLSQIATANTWTKMSGTFTVPANTFTLLITLNSDATTGFLWIDEIVIRRVKNSEVIANNAITTTKIANEAVTGAKTAGLDGSKITGGLVAETVIAPLPASKINVGTFNDARIPSLDAGKITTGSFADARIPTLDAGKITTGSFLDARIPNLDGSKITSGSVAEGRVENLTTTRTTANTANTTANVAKSIVSTALYAKDNLATDPGFENTNLWIAGSYSTEQKRSGLRSMRLVAVNGTWVTMDVVSDDTAIRNAKTIGGGTYYVEFWVRGHTSNVNTTSNVFIQTSDKRSGNPDSNTIGPIIAGGTALSGVWTKVSGYMTLPADTVESRFYFVLNAALSSGNIYYFDDLVITNVTESINTNKALYNTNTPASSILTSAVPSLDGSKITSGTLADARIPTLDAAKIGTGSFVDARIPTLDAGKITTGSFADARIPTLDAAKIGTGSFLDARIPTLDATKITSGTLNDTRIPTLDAAKIGTGSFADARIPNLAQTKITNLTTDLSTIDGKAVTAQTGVNRVSAVAAGKLSAQTNLCADPDCSRSNAWTTNPLAAATVAVSTEQFRSSPSSLKMTVASSGFPGFNLIQDGMTNVSNGGIRLDCDPDDVFYAECWVRANASNVNTKQMNIQFLGHDTITGGADYATGTWANTPLTTVSSTAWTKLSGIWKVPAGRNQVTIAVWAGNNGTIGDSYYIDDIIVRELTATNQINKALYNADSPASVILAGAVPAIDGSKINTGTLAEDRISSLSAGKITTGTFADARIPTLDAAKIGTGSFADARIPTLDAAKIGTGSFVDARIPGLDASKITGGTLNDTRIPNLAQTKITNLTTDLSTIDGKAVTAQNSIDVKTRDFTNIAAGSDFETTNPWALGSGFSIATDVPGHTGTKSLKSTGVAGTCTLTGVTVQVQTGEQFYVEFWVRRDAAYAQTNTALSRLRIHNPDTPNTMGFLSFALGDIPTADTWTKRSMTFTVPALDYGSNPITRMAFQIQSDPSTGGSVWIDNIVIRRISTSDVIADNAVTTAKINAAAITNAKVATDAIATANIQSNAVTGAKTSGLDAAKITSGQMAQAQVLNLPTDLATVDERAKSGTNLIPDPSFENSSLDSARLATISSTTVGTWSFTTDRPRSGTRSLKQIYNSALGGGYTNLFLTPNLKSNGWIPVRPGQVYYASVWVYADPNNNGTGNIEQYLELSTSLTSATGVSYVQIGGASNYPKGQWRQISKYVTIPDNGSKAMRLYACGMRLGNVTGDTFWFDDIELYEVTEAMAARGVATESNLSGANICTNPGFENTSFYLTTQTRVEYHTGTTNDPAFRGSRCLKITAQPSTWPYTYLTTNESTNLFSPCAGNDVYYLEYQVRGATTNVQTSGGNQAIMMAVTWRNAAGTSTPNLDSTATITASTALNGVWTKVTGYVTMPATAVAVAPYIQVRGATENEVYYFDEVVCRPITESANTNKALFNQNTPATNIIGNALPVAIDASKLTTGTLPAGAIAAGAIDNSKIASGVDAAKLTTGTLPVARIADGAVGNAKLASDIDAGKISSGAFGEARISDNAITTAKINSNAVTNVKVFNDIDASKIGSGSIVGARILDGAIDSTKLASAVNNSITTAQNTANTTNDNIASSLFNDSTSTGAANALAALIKTFTDLSSNTKAIQELQSAKNALTTKGGSWAVDFGNFSTMSAAGFSVSYSGAGTSTIGISNGIAQWTVNDNNSRDAKLIYNIDTVTSFQSVRGTMSAPPQPPAGGGSTPYFYAINRVSSDGLNYVWARAYAVSFGNYKADIGYCVNGTEIAWATGINLTWSLDMRFVAGVGTNLREYQIWSGNKVVYSYTESTIVSRLCSNSAHTTDANHDGSCTIYRRWGAIAQVRSSKTAGKVEFASATDAGTPSVNGSVARMTRTSTSNVNYVGGNTTTALTSFFDSIPHESLDIDAVTSSGSFKVTISKPYIISARIHLSANVLATGTLYLQRSTNNGSTWSTVQFGNTIYTSNGEALSGQWIQYLNADEMVRLAYNRNGATVSALTGDSSGAQTYFAIASAEGAG